MADRTIKPDDTHDLVLQNNDGSAKIEVNEAQTVVLTGGSTTALTIDTSGNTTLAGTANNIGTVTSGTFNGALSATTTGGGAMASGSVSQAGGTSGDPGTGTPTGHIVEEGHTSKGTYVKFANGTMICTNTMSNNIAFTSSYGNVYIGTDTNASSHPATFATVTGAGIIVTSSSGGRAFPSNVTITISQISTIDYIHPTSNASLGVTSKLVIYGTWY